MGKRLLWWADDRCHDWPLGPSQLPSAFRWPELSNQEFTDERALLKFPGGMLQNESATTGKKYLQKTARKMFRRILGLSKQIRGLFWLSLDESNASPHNSLTNEAKYKPIEFPDTASVGNADNGYTQARSLWQAHDGNGEYRREGFTWMVRSRIHSSLESGLFPSHHVEALNR